MLSAVTTADDPYGSLPESDLGSMDYYSAAADSPLGDEISEYADEFTSFQASSQDLTSEAWTNALDTQDQNSDPNATTDGSDDGTSDDGTTDDQDATEEEQFPGFLEQIIGRLVSSDSDAETADSNDDTQDSTATTAVSRLTFPEHVQFAETSLPIQQFDDNLFAVTPDGTDSFTTITATESTVLPSSIDDANTAGVIPTSLTNEVTLEQTWNGSDDWIVQQSVTNSFSDSSPDNDDTDAAVTGRTGSESYSVAVINGTTTVSTYSITDNRTQQVGSIPGLADDAEADPFAIPQDWINRSRTSVANDDGTGDGDGESTAVEDGAGIVEESDTGLTITVTTTQIVLPDGTLATEMTTTASWSASFEWKSGGSFSGDETDLDDDDSNLPSGLTASVESKYEVYASASIGATFSVTVVTPTAGDDLTPEVSVSFGFAISVMAGGSMSSTTKLNLDESSGSVDDDTDTYSKIIVNDVSEASGSMGFSFWVAYSSEDSADEGASGGDDGDQAVVLRSAAGQASATELLEDNTSGAQFDFNVTSSNSSTQDHTIEEKTRHSTSYDFGYEQFSLSDVQTAGSDQHVTIAMGTEEMLIDIGSKGSSSITKIADYEYKTTAAPGSYYDGHTEGSASTFNEKSESSYEFGLKLGGEDGFGLTNDSSYDVDVSAMQKTYSGDSGYIYDLVYRDYSDDVGEEITANGDPLPEKVHRKTETFFSPGGDTVNVIFDLVPGAESDSHRSPEEILADYQAQMTQIYHLQALIEITDDPETRERLQNEINVHTQILAGIIDEATSAGISSAALAEADAAAQAAVDANPPTWTEDDGGAFFDGSWFDGGAFGGTFAGEIGSLGESFSGMYYSISRDQAAANNAFAAAYANGPLGLTANSSGFYYYGTGGALAVAVGATAAAVAARVMPQMSIGVAKNGHFAWTRGAQWWHATSRGTGVFRAAEFTGAAAQRLGYGAWRRTLTLPVLSPHNAIFAGTTANCATGASWAWFNAGGAVALPIVIDTGLLSGFFAYWGMTE